MIQPVVKPVWQPCWMNSHCSFIRVVKPVWQLDWQPVVSCIQTFTQLSNRF